MAGTLVQDRWRSNDVNYASSRRQAPLTGCSRISAWPAFAMTTTATRSPSFLRVGKSVTRKKPPRNLADQRLLTLDAAVIEQRTVSVRIPPASRSQPGHTGANSLQADPWPNAPLFNGKLEEDLDLGGREEPRLRWIVRIVMVYASLLRMRLRTNCPCIPNRFHRTPASVSEGAARHCRRDDGPRPPGGHDGGNAGARRRTPADGAFA